MKFENTVAAGLIFALAIVLGLGLFGLIRSHHDHVDQVTSDQHVTTQEEQSRAAFAAMTICAEGGDLPEGTTGSLFVGENSAKTVPDPMAKCVFMIGNNTIAPQGASYFLNIGNRICMSLKTGKKLKCPVVVKVSE